VLCARCATANPDTAKFCSECGVPLAGPPQVEQRKVVSILFCDVAGSTSLGERLDPEALREVMARYFDTARAAIERHGGTVEKFIGDAVMAVFGIPTVHEDDALRAVRAAQELRDGVDIDVRIGVNTGRVVTGGADTLATGDAVNVAARLEQTASAGEVLLGEATYLLVRDAVEAELLAPVAAKGKSEPLTAYRLGAVTGDLQRRDAAPMIGRARELELLHRAYERTDEERACHLFTVLGTAGIGKSRLVEEFLASLGGVRIVRGRCVSYGEGITYWPVVEVLKQLRVEPTGPLAAVFGDQAAVTEPSEIAWAVRRTLERVADDAPLVVVFDDVQWGEDAFLDLIEHIADLSRGVPLLLLCMARPELLDVRPGWAGGKLNATSVLLGPLPAEETTALVETLLGSEDGGLVERIGAAADGNPLFVEEMVELARSSGGDVAVPPTIQALLAARLDSLPASERIVLERGSVEGQVFHRGAVAALAPDEQQVDTRLVSLVRKELVRPDRSLLAADDAYRFRHLLIRDAAYEALPKATRIELHERFAAWLDEHGADLVELDEIVGHHLEQASRYARELGRDATVAAREAARRLAVAAERADLRGDAGAAVKLLRRSLALLPQPDPLLQLHLAGLLYYGGDIDEALRLIDAQRGGPAEIRATVLRHSFGDFGATHTEILVELEEAIAQLEAAGDAEGVAQGLIALAFHLQWSGDTEQAGAVAMRARDQARQAGDLRLEMAATEAVGQTIVWTSTPWPEIEAFAREWVEDERQSRRVRGRAHMLVGRCKAARGDWEQAAADFARSREIFEEIGQSLLRGAFEMHAAHTEWLHADFAAMEERARECWDRLGAIGERGYRSTGGAMLAEALVRLGRVEEAAAILEEAEVLGGPDDYITLEYCLGVRGLVAAAHGEEERAVELLREAVEIADGTGDLENAARMRVVLAERLRAAGRPDDAETVVAEVVALADRKQNRALAARAQAVLA
jgi:class 3 adenylate cyclase/tetratricopeptide (TPR) repeat protein